MDKKKYQYEIIRVKRRDDRKPLYKAIVTSDSWSYEENSRTFKNKADATFWLTMEALKS